MHLGRFALITGVVASIVSPALAQVENADLRIRAQFRTPHSDSWGADASVGNAEFRVHSRFLQLYYGGVRRADEFRFTVQIDFRGISGFADHFGKSTFNTDMDVYINGAFVGRADMNATDLGLAELQYDSRHPDPPALPLPANFPEPVNTFDVVSVYAAVGEAPEIASPPPAGAPLFSSELLERFARGDVNQDGKVDLDDFPYLESNYDPCHSAQHIGPANGDFTGDNACDHADYAVMAANWTDRHDIPAEPAHCAADFNCDAGVTSQDFFDFLGAFFSADTRADLDGDGSVASPDFFAFLTAFFGGC